MDDIWEISGGSTVVAPQEAVAVAVWMCKVIHNFLNQYNWLKWRRNKKWKFWECLSSLAPAQSGKGGIALTVQATCWLTQHGRSQQVLPNQQVTTGKTNYTIDMPTIY
jgi:hypothetical protein